jgi:uncharacterized protein HemX
VIFKDKFADRRSQHDELNPVRDSELNEALTDFRLSVHAWSENAFSRSRMVAAAAPPRRVWRLAAGWALGCVLIAGGASAGVWQHQQREMRIAVARVAEQQRLVALQKNQQAQQQEDEDLLAKVDRDVSREVPVAMEPLAQLMGEDETP